MSKLVKKVFFDNTAKSTAEALEFLSDQAVALGISDAPLLGNSQRAGRACFDLMGRRVAGSQRGIVLRRQADGTVRKVMVHEQYR